MEFVIIAGVIIVFTVWPVMLAARFMGAEDFSFFACLTSVVIAFIASIFAAQYLENENLARVADILIAAVCFTFILKTPFPRALFIAVIANIIQFVLVLLLAALGYSLAVLS